MLPEVDLKYSVKSAEEPDDAASAALLAIEAALRRAVLRTVARLPVQDEVIFVRRSRGLMLAGTATAFSASTSSSSSFEE